ncbi:hypothetical protein Y032_0008g40 [Ancylostoma ceylanicum]|uniref:Uncharacterized protein n=1 Tax=Ancylostoma ceylanicum TaxID=53326 RepID=A0A016VLN1_9BILA|nr:hypothetical protein Y032_0008g40 [Ancylostoma ceylanicum]
MYCHLTSEFLSFVVFIVCVGHRPSRTINHAYRCSSGSDALDSDEDRYVISFDLGSDSNDYNYSFSRRCHDFGVFEDETLLVNMSW